MPFLSTHRQASSDRQDADLRAYAQTGDAEAFRRMVERHLCTVQQAGARVLGAGSGLAEDVAQDVFLTLARKARELPGDTILVAWLHRQAVRRAIDVVRSESRRRKRETIANSLTPAEDTDGQTWNAILPRLDRELLRLPGLDQKIVTLRIMERCSSEEAARRLGLTSAAVRKRLERALSRLRERLAGPVPGTLTVTALGAYLSVPTAKAASASQVAAVSSHSLAAAAAPAPIASLATFGFMTKSQTIVAGSILLIGAGSFLAGSRSAPGVVATDRAAVSMSSVSEFGAAAHERTAGNRGSRSSDGAEFPATREGRLALLRAILSDGDPVSRSQALEHFIGRVDPREYQGLSSFLAAQKPETALEFQAIASAQQALFSEWAKRDPAEALRATGSLTTGKEPLVQTIASIWGAQNPDAAIAWARSRPGYPEQYASEDSFMMGLIGSVATQDLRKATGLLEEMPSGFTRSMALNGMLSRLMTHGDDSAARWIDSLSDEGLKKGANNRVAEEMASINPEQAVNWIVSRMGADAEHSSMDNVFKQWARTDGGEAKKHFDALPAGAVRADALAAIAEAISEKGEAADFRWIYDRMKGADTDRGSYQAVFDRWTSKDPQEAIRHFEELPGDAATSVSEGIVHGLVSSGDPEAALGFVKDHFDRISESALVQALSKLDEAASDAALDDLEERHPGAEVISTAPENLSTMRDKR